jgi:hypothetical protein
MVEPPLTLPATVVASTVIIVGVEVVAKQPLASVTVTV